MPGPTLEKHENGTYYVHWSEGGRSKRVSTRQTDLSKAEIFLGTWLLEAKDDTPERLTCQELFDFYLKNRGDKIVSPERVQRAWLNLREAFAELMPADVTQDRIDRYIRDRQRGVISQREIVVNGIKQSMPAAVSTVWHELRVLVTTWNFGVKRRLIASTVLPVIELPDAPTPRDRWLTREEADRLFAAAAKMRIGCSYPQCDCAISFPEGHKPSLATECPSPKARTATGKLGRTEIFLWLALETAARKRAIETLTWAQVDFEIRVVHYLPPGAAQTSKRRASVPISDALLPVLRQAYAERESDYVLFDTRDASKGLNRLAAAAGVADVTPHVLRHTAATWMARDGVPLWTIAGVLGNTADMVDKVYAKHSPAGMREAVNSISGGRLRVVK